MVWKEPAPVSNQFHEIWDILISEWRGNERGKVKIRTSVHNNVLNLSLSHGKEFVADKEIS